jgi:hypothetical protein
MTSFGSLLELFSPLVLKLFADLPTLIVCVKLQIP